MTWPDAEYPDGQLSGKSRILNMLDMWSNIRTDIWTNFRLDPEYNFLQDIKKPDIPSFPNKLTKLSLKFSGADPVLAKTRIPGLCILNELRF